MEYSIDELYRKSSGNAGGERAQRDDGVQAMRSATAPRKMACCPAPRLQACRGSQTCRIAKGSERGGGQGTRDGPTSQPTAQPGTCLLGSSRRLMALATISFSCMKTSSVASFSLQQG